MLAIIEFHRAISQLAKQRISHKLGGPQSPAERIFSALLLPVRFQYENDPSWRSRWHSPLLP
jgi:hypothetical protein